MTTATARAATEVWWGEWTLAPGSALHWRIGPLDLFVERTPKEWLL